MKNGFSLQQISRTGNLDPNRKTRQYKLDLMSNSMRFKFENPKMKQSETANQLVYSTSAFQRYRADINMPSPNRFHPNNTNKPIKKGKSTNFDTNSHRDPDLKIPRTNQLKIKKRN